MPFLGTQVRFVAFGDNFVSEAAHDVQPSSAGCMVGTRVGVLDRFITWPRDDPLSIFWLAGMAGTGKTSIAVSLCRALRNDPDVLLGGGYFCSRSAGSIARTDVRRILPTLAVLLASQSREFAEPLFVQLNDDRRVAYKPVAEQIGPLFQRPLNTLAASSRPIVFLIDALDECGNEREVAELLRILADFQCETKVKFIITSRPEMHIRGNPISNPDHNTILHLHTIGEEQVASDIRLYIGNTLKDAVIEWTWYTEHDIELLVKLSGGLFIFASTVLKYVIDQDVDEGRKDRLRKVTSVATKRTVASNTIDKVYELVLKEASRTDVVDADELEEMGRIIACILTARVSLSVEVLADLLELRPHTIRGSLRRLHSLIHVPSSDAEPGLQSLHASFGDFMFERAPSYLHVIASYGHDVLALACLRRLGREDLCFNVSRSVSSFKSNLQTIPDWIPPSLIYACLHWAHHIDAASDCSAFDDGIGQKFRPKFLFWLKVLSVIGKASLASGLLRIAGSAVSWNGHRRFHRLILSQVQQQDIAQFLRDANAFVASSQTAINTSAPHI